MNIRLKTAHGYLSFQPDGSIQYREHAAIWETIDLEGFAVEPVPAPAPTPDPFPAVPAEASATYVRAVRAALRQQGVDLSGPCGAFAITKHVAWGLRATGIGLLSKPGGNNCEGYSVDGLCYPSGDFVDILGDAGGQNDPIWIFTANNVDPSRWRAPVQP